MNRVQSEILKDTYIRNIQRFEIALKAIENLALNYAVDQEKAALASIAIIAKRVINGGRA